MTTDKNKVSETLEVPLENWNELVRENRRLRQERDELVGALEATWSALEASPCDPDITADQIAAHAELKKHDVMALLSKHKPE